MPDSQFGQSPGSLTATLDELVALARHLRETPADIPSRLTRLEGLAKMLDYFSTPRVPSDTPSDQWPIALTTHCSHISCGKTWRDYDACLLNFAPTDTPPIWLCRDHHPPTADGGIRPPGWQPDIATRTAVIDARDTALRKIDRATDLPLLNSRV